MQPQPYGPPMYGPPGARAPMPPRRKSRTGMTVLIIVLSAVFVLCCLPTGFLGARYLTYETGPYHRLPNLCASVDGEEVAELVGNKDGLHEPGDVDGTPQDKCTWVSLTEPKRLVAVRAELYGRRWNQSSLDHAREFYAFNVGLTKDFMHGPVSEARLVAGQEGDCFAGTSDNYTVEYGCVVRAGNAIFIIDVLPPRVDKSKGKPLTSSDLFTAVNSFVAGFAHTFAEDVVEEL